MAELVDTTEVTKTPKQVLGPNQERWLAALESGEFRQGQYRLRTPSVDGPDKFCCLEVAAELFCDHYEHSHQSCPGPAQDALAFESSSAALFTGLRMHDKWRFLTDANDGGVTFAEIAAFCRANPSAVFTEPR